ncbi:hypothetical protein [Aliarcobacter butzleri]|uniref:hypothetical protein n=1 Tax=Aliarcobacter butzleri TaxID=28197 RepID=UPI002B253E7F|nr:hypothetical protein [Aliarcobacter butzleri]
MKNKEFDFLKMICFLLNSTSNAMIMHTPEPFGQPADLHPDTLPKLIRTVSRFIFGQF